MQSVARRKPFSKREDEVLKKLVAELGDKDWAKIAKRMSHRTAKQCRDRYNNYLSADFKIGLWTDQEMAELRSHVQTIGPKWVEISKRMPSRSPNDLKNRWYKHILKRKDVDPEPPDAKMFCDRDALNLGEFDEEQIITMFSVSEASLDDPGSADKMEEK